MHTTPFNGSLKAILNGLTSQEMAKDIAISGIASDSREVQPGYVFFACKGELQDGVDFINDAVERGAIVIVVDETILTTIKVDIPVVGVTELNKNLGVIAARYFSEPSLALTLIGITGTNGKTSCSHLLAQCLSDQAGRAGVIGTMGYGYFGELKPLANTTPGPVELQRSIAELRNDGVKAIAMEVSSHGLEQFRTRGCHFSVAVFTNLSRDHLDYHGSMEAYGAAKLKLFKDAALNTVVINLDDDYAEKIIHAVDSKVEVIGVSLEANKPSTGKYLNAKILNKTLGGCNVEVTSSWGDCTLHTPLLGEFNVSNVLLVLAVALHAGLDLPEAANRIQTLKVDHYTKESSVFATLK